MKRFALVALAIVSVLRGSLQDERYRPPPRPPAPVSRYADDARPDANLSRLRGLTDEGRAPDPEPSVTTSPPAPDGNAAPARGTRRRVKRRVRRRPVPGAAPKSRPLPATETSSVSRSSTKPTVTVPGRRSDGRQPKVITPSDKSDGPEPRVITPSDKSGDGPEPKVAASSRRSVSLKPKATTPSNKSDDSLEPKVTTPSDKSDGPEPRVTTPSDKSVGLKPKATTPSNKSGDSPEPKATTTSDKSGDSPEPKATTPSDKSGHSSGPKATLPSHRSDFWKRKMANLINSYNVQKRKTVARPSNKIDNLKPKITTPSENGDGPEPKAAMPSTKSDGLGPKATTPSDISDVSEPKATTPTNKSDSPEPKATTPTNKNDSPEPKVSTLTNKNDGLKKKLTSRFTDMSNILKWEPSTPAYYSGVPEPKATTPSDNSGSPEPKAATPFGNVFGLGNTFTGFTGMSNILNWKPSTPAYYGDGQTNKWADFTNFGGGLMPVPATPTVSFYGGRVMMDPAAAAVDRVSTFGPAPTFRKLQYISKNDGDMAPAARNLSPDGQTNGAVSTPEDPANEIATIVKTTTSIPFTNNMSKFFRLMRSSVDDMNDYGASKNAADSANTDPNGETYKGRATKATLTGFRSATV